MNLKKYLVTGAAGFIGAALARRLIAKGHYVVAVDDLSNGCRKRIPEEAIFFEADCSNSILYEKIKQHRFDCIFHLAGQSSSILSFKDPILDLKDNVTSTLQLIKFAKQIKCGKIIYASTVNIYSDSLSPVSECEEPKPLSFYAIHKWASENYLRLNASPENNFTVLRLANVYGPGQYSKKGVQGVIGILISQGIKDGCLSILGPANRYRDFIYIDDAVNAFESAESEGGKAYCCYNVSTMQSVTFDSLANIIVSKLGHNIGIEYLDMQVHDRMGVIADNTNIKTNLRWSPKMNLTTGIEKTIEWSYNNLNIKAT